MDLFYLICPSCGIHVQVKKDSKTYKCESCKGEHVVHRNGCVASLVSMEEELVKIQYGSTTGEATLAIKKLRAEIKNLEVELQELSRQGSPLDSVRAIGFGIITLFLLFAILNSSTDVSLFAFGAIGIVMGIVIHSSTELFGKNYFVRKAYLKELIQKKRAEVARQEHILAQ